MSIDQNQPISREAANFNLKAAAGFLGIVILMGIVLLVVLLIGNTNIADQRASIHDSISNTLSQNEIDDVEGYGLLAEGFAYGVYSLSEIAITIVFLILIGIPLVAALLLLLLAGIARIVYAKSRIHFLPYRILVILQYTLTICFTVVFLIAITENIGVNILLLIPSLLLLAAAINVFLGIHCTFFSGSCFIRIN